MLIFVGSALADVPVIPLPQEVKPQEGELELAGEVEVALPPGGGSLVLPTLREVGLDVREGGDESRIRFVGASDLDGDRFGPAPEGEGYLLMVRPHGIRVYAAEASGHFYGLQTLAQLVEGAPRCEEGVVTLAAMDIRDEPRFGYRGFMLDESRHFSGMEAVKRLLDGMARLKMNRFHWHLTDSPGWRIEIKAFPKLTTVGGRGAETDVRDDAPAQYYTQDQIRGILAYAAARHIVVIPEIDMPGHADAAVKAYPEHGGGGYLQRGSTVKWPNFTFNPAREETLAFLDTILAEVAGLFPEAGIIHFGGDEVHFGWHHWPELPEVQALKEREGFTELAEVEAWFNRRMAGVINDLGFKTGGWDEITGRDLPIDKTVIYWWRHDRRDVLGRALERGYPVVLCPRRPAYFDFVQHDSHQVGRRWGGYNPLADVHVFPDCLGLDWEEASTVLGVQACLWTEVTVSQARRDFMTWPRLIAMAEAGWTNAGRKDFACFEERLRPWLGWLDSRGIGYFDPFEGSEEVTDEGVAVEYLDMPE